MELCDDGHDQVCYDDRECPVCAAVQQASDLKDAAESLDDYPLSSVAEGLSMLRDTIKKFTELVGPMDELLLTLKTSATQLQAPWHDRDSYLRFGVLVEQLDQLLIHVSAIETDKDDLKSWESMVNDAAEEMRNVKSAADC